MNFLGIPRCNCTQRVFCGKCDNSGDSIRFGIKNAIVIFIGGSQKGGSRRVVFAGGGGGCARPPPRGPPQKRL